VHIHNYTEYNQQWNVFSEFNPSKCTHTLGAVGSRHRGARGAVGGSVPCSRVSPQSWTIPAGAEIQTHNLWLQVLSIRPRLPPVVYNFCRSTTKFMLVYNFCYQHTVLLTNTLLYYNLQILVLLLKHFAFNLMLLVISLYLFFTYTKCIYTQHIQKQRTAFTF